VTEESSWYDELQPRAAAEAKVIVEAFRDRELDKFHDRKVEIGVSLDPAEDDDDVTGGGIAFMYAKGHILTRERYLGGVGGIPGIQDVLSASKQRGVLDILQENHVQEVEVRRVVRDIVLLRLYPPLRKDTGNDEPRGSEDTTPDDQAGNAEDSGRSPGDSGETPADDRETAEREPPDVLRLLKLIDLELGEGIATPDQVLTAANGEMHPCSATEPQQVYPTAGPYPAVCRDGGARVRIFIADTGLLKDADKIFPWLHGVKGDLDQRTELGGEIKPYGGHGTFVAGVLRCMAPEAQIRVANIFDTAGSALESELVPRLNEAFGFGFEILHLTASCMTRNNIPLIALEAWLELLRPEKGVVCVAPAGNNHTRRPSWPGAFSGVISVGALATDWHSRADFSDYGGWVDVYAPGQRLINAFGKGEYRCQFTAQEEVREFNGLAQWSGTSFSAPIVTGLIAARMARCGESAREAAAAWLAKARTQNSPGVGPVLLPCCGDDDERCGHCGCGHCGCGREHGCGCPGGGCGGGGSGCRGGGCGCGGGGCGCGGGGCGR
jgi:hypothetical protein